MVDGERGSEKRREVVVEKNIDEIRKIFNSDKFATQQANCYIVEADKNYAKVTMSVQSYHMNANGFVMGGSIYTLADFTFAVASNAYNDMTVTSCGSIDYLAPARTDLTAIAKLVKDGKSLVVYQIEVTDGSGKLVAVATMRGQKVRA